MTTLHTDPLKDPSSQEPFLHNQQVQEDTTSSVLNARSASICSATGHVFLEDLKKPKTDQCVKDVESGQNTVSSVIGWRRYLGVFYTILAINMLALTNTIMKKYSNIHPFNVGVWSSITGFLVAFLCTVFACLRKKPEEPSIFAGLFPLSKTGNLKSLFLVFLRGILTSVIFYLSVAAFKYISAADLRTVISSVVIAVFIFGWLFLGEKCGVVPIITAIVALLGIGIMTRPPMLTGAEEFDTGTMIGIGLSFLTMVIIALHLVVIRYLSEVHHGLGNMIVMAWSAVQGVILSWAFGLLFPLPEIGDILGLMASGIFLGFSMTFLVLALQNEEAGVVALVRTSEVIFVFFWQWVIVGTKPDLISIIGATLVISGVVTVTLRKWVENMPKDSNMRKRLKFILV